MFRCNFCICNSLRESVPFLFQSCFTSVSGLFQPMAKQHSRFVITSYSRNFTLVSCFLEKSVFLCPFVAKRHSSVAKTRHDRITTHTQTTLCAATNRHDRSPAKPKQILKDHPDTTRVSASHLCNTVPYNGHFCQGKCLEARCRIQKLEPDKRGVRN